MKKAIAIVTAIMLLISAVPSVNAVGNEPAEKQNSIAAGAYHTAWIANGGVEVVGNAQEHYMGDTDWTDVVQIAAYHQTFGLRSDGTVVVSGNGRFDAEDFEDWHNIVAIDANECDVIGLRSDGTVIMAGRNDDNFTAYIDLVEDIAEDLLGVNITYWKDIVDVAQGTYAAYGVTADGYVKAVGFDSSWDQVDDVDDWKNIVAVTAGHSFVAGLKQDGTVVVGGVNRWADMDVSGWTDIVAIRAGSAHLVGLRSDGTVVATGYNNHGQCDVEGLTDIVAIDAGFFHTVALTSSGKLVGVGSNAHSQCNLS